MSTPVQSYLLDLTILASCLMFILTYARAKINVDKLAKRKGIAIGSPEHARLLSRTRSVSLIIFCLIALSFTYQVLRDIRVILQSATINHNAIWITPLVFITAVACVFAVLWAAKYVGQHRNR